MKRILKCFLLCRTNNPSLRMTISQLPDQIPYGNRYESRKLAHSVWPTVSACRPDIPMWFARHCRMELYIHSTASQATSVSFSAQPQSSVSQSHPSGAKLLQQVSGQTHASSPSTVMWLRLQQSSSL